MTIPTRRLLMAAAAVGAALALAGCNQSGGGGATPVDSMTLGNPNAPVKMEEYASVTCSHCGLSLLVRDHYSRRIGAFQGVCIDAEEPGTVPQPEELFP